MITIPVEVVQMPDGLGDGGTLPANTPTTPIPANAIAVVCDGTNYTVYEPGDAVPST